MRIDPGGRPWRESQPSSLMIPTSTSKQKILTIPKFLLTFPHASFLSLFLSFSFHSVHLHSFPQPSLIRKYRHVITRIGEGILIKRRDVCVSVYVRGEVASVYFQFPDLASRGTVDSLINFKRGRVREEEKEMRGMKEIPWDDVH